MKDRRKPTQVEPSLRQLRCFLLAVDKGSIGRAAEESGLSQPAASNAIAALERSLGTSLLARHGGGSAATRAGEMFKLRAERFFTHLTQGLTGVGTDETRIAKLLAALRLAHLRALIAIAESGTFTGAARQLGISGPGLHRSAREVEKLLRIPLFRLGADGIGVNSSGEAIARAARLAVQEIWQARDEIGREGEGALGRISLGILPLLPKHWVARVIARTKRDHPDVAIALREDDYADLLRDLRWGALDMIVGALPSTADEADIVQEALFADPYVVVVRRGHSLAKLRAVTSQMLTAHDWVVPSRNTPRRAALERFFATLPARPRIWLDTSSPGTMMAVVAETDCITLISRTQLFTDVPANLAVLPVKIADSGRRVGITRRRDWLPTVVQRGFLEILRETSPGAVAKGP
jgi:DNA-binding transcriptional LysR family regulator